MLYPWCLGEDGNYGIVPKEEGEEGRIMLTLEIKKSMIEVEKGLLKKMFRPFGICLLLAIWA